jgi:hypothetical protein
VIVNSKTWLKKRNKIDREHEQSPDLSGEDQFSVVEETVTASKCVSSEEPELQAIKLRPITGPVFLGQQNRLTRIPDIEEFLE